MRARSSSEAERCRRRWRRRESRDAHLRAPRLGRTVDDSQSRGLTSGRRQQVALREWSDLENLLVGREIPIALRRSALLEKRLAHLGTLRQKRRVAIVRAGPLAEPSAGSSLVPTDGCGSGADVKVGIAGQRSAERDQGAVESALGASAVSVRSVRHEQDGPGRRCRGLVLDRRDEQLEGATCSLVKLRHRLAQLRRHEQRLGLGCGVDEREVGLESTSRRRSWVPS